jgi:methionyl-tRNA formyltransferase
MQPETLAAENVQARLRSMQPDFMIVAAYGLLLPPVVLEIPRVACINVHASILPRWRGASPVQAAILAGDAVSGVSIMRMGKGLDSGPVYAARETAIGDRETAGDLEMRLADIGAELLINSLAGILDGSCVSEAQDESGVTHAPRIDKRDALIDWNDAAIAIDRQIRAFNPWPVAETSLDGLRLRCWSAEPEPASDPGGESDGAPGQVIDAAAGFISVKTGRGTLRLTEVQLPGRRKVSAAEFANGHPVFGKVLGR